MAAFSTARKFAWSLTALLIALIVLWFALAWLHSTFSSNIIGQTAGVLGSRGSGQSYQF